MGQHFHPHQPTPTSPRRIPQNAKGKKAVSKFQIWAFPKIGVPQNGWLIMENPIKDDLGVPLFLETPICFTLAKFDIPQNDGSQNVSPASNIVIIFAFQFVKFQRGYVKEYEWRFQIAGLTNQMSKLVYPVLKGWDPRILINRLYI